MTPLRPLQQLVLVLLSLNACSVYAVAPTHSDRAPAETLLSLRHTPSNPVNAPSLQVHNTVAKPQQRRIPQGTLMLSEDSHYLFWAEAEKGLLHLLQRHDNGGFTTVKTINMSIGKLGYGKTREGDKRTPIGVYRITSFLTDEQLTDFYGLGAYPLDYPNANDKLNQRTGHGIWLHGLPKGVDSRPPRDSDGCVVIDNNNLSALADYITTGDTYVVIDKELKWQSLVETQKSVADIENHFYQWIAAWKTIDNDTYLNFYAESFTNLDKDKTHWDNYKRRIHRNKKFIDVKISNLSIFDYPGEKNLITVRYYQAYNSNNYHWRGWKEQLWKNIEGQWKIVYEGDA